MGFIINVLRGLLIGTGFVIPGVSGGTLAVVFGIYDKLIKAIRYIYKNLRENLKQFKEDVWFLFQIGIGAVVGIFITSFILKGLFDNYEGQAMYLFAGLIGGSIPILYKKAAASSKINVSCILSFIISFIAMILIAVLKEPGESPVVAKLDFTNAVLFFISGFLAILAMIIPGISGSFILLLIGTYRSVLEAVTSFNIPILIVFVAGIGIGFILTVSIINYILNKFPGQSYWGILGLVAGSVVQILVLCAKEGHMRLDLSYAVCVICLIIGFIVSFFFSNGKHAG